MTAPVVISYGGGVQSTAMVVLAVAGELGYRPDVALFANVGDDSEHPATLAYVREVAVLWAARHGLEVRELDRRRRDGSTETLFGRLTREGSRSLPIPVRMAGGAPGTRSCTADFKIRVIGKWLREHGASPTDPATVCIGISVDEIHRANNRSAHPHERVTYPLLELGHRRTDCARIIASAGLAVPPKSSCWFCPFHRPSTWQAMRIEEPELFERAAGLEDLLNARRAELGKDPVFLTRFGTPLRTAIPAGAQFLPFPTTDPAPDPAGAEPMSDDDPHAGGCDGGWCAA